MNSARVGGRGWLVALALTIGLAGCAGDDATPSAGSSSPPTTTASDVPPPTTTASDVPPVSPMPSGPDRMPHVDDTTDPGAGSAPTLVARGAWVFTKGTIDGASFTAPDDQGIWFTVADGTMSGVAVCNSFTASLDGNPDTVTISQLSFTEIGCDPPLMEAEQTFLGALPEVDTITVVAGTMVMSGPDVELHFADHPQALPE